MGYRSKVQVIQRGEKNRQFHLRGLGKVLMECLGACLSYNIQQWIRLRWRTVPAVAT